MPIKDIFKCLKTKFKVVNYGRLENASLKMSFSLEPKSQIVD